MTDGEPTTPAPRRRPSYGLPGPAEAAPPVPGAPAAGPHSAAPSGASSFGAPDFSQQSAPGYAPEFPTAAPVAGGSPAAVPPGGPVTHKRRGLIPLIVGAVLLLIIGPVAAIGGIAWSMSSLIGDTAQGPVVIEGGTGDIDLAANEMVILYVPSADAAAGATCEATATDPGQITSVPTSGTTTFPSGETYEQSLGVVATADTTVTINCDATDTPGYLGPYGIWAMAAPLLLGPLIGIGAGLLGLVLIIVGIVKLVRSRRV